MPESSQLNDSRGLLQLCYDKGFVVTLLYSLVFCVQIQNGFVFECFLLQSVMDLMFVIVLRTLLMQVSPLLTLYRNSLFEVYQDLTRPCITWPSFIVEMILF